MSGRRWAVRVYGTPAPKGSMRCIGARGGRGHQLIEDNAKTKPWRERVAVVGNVLGLAEPIAGPLGVEITFTMERPKSVRNRVWPHKRGSNDVDKLARTLLDGLQDAAVFADDAQVVELTARKGYPDSPVPDVMERPGAVIRIYEME